MKSKMTIRSKFAAALAVPLAALAAMAGVQARDAWTARDDARIQVDLATTSLGPSGVITALQNERNFQALRAIGLEGAVHLAVSSSDGAITATDFGRGSFRDSLEQVDPAAAGIYLPALGVMEGELDGLRRTADDLAENAALDNAAGASDLFDSYTDLIDNLLDANDQVPVNIDDSTLRTGVELLGALSRQNDVEARIVREASVAGLLQDRAAGLEARRLTGVQTAGEDRIRNLAQGDYQRPIRSVLGSPDRATYVEALQAVAADPLATDIQELLATVPKEASSQLRGAQTGVGSVVRNRAAEVRSAADGRLHTYGGLALGAVLLAVLVLALANLWITRPLRRLAREARAMATERLPEAVNGILATPLGEDVVLPEVAPVRVRGGGEVAGVVNALNQVQESALELAAEQALLRRNVADSFVNLGRRNQNLLGRQIELISQLEADEQNADELEFLFRLDHLATRMRRNAESLLVLAGEEPARQWSAPVDIGDVVRAALGEVEEYRRVRLRTMDEATISGRAVADVSHTLAELLDNALSFSPPDSNVDVWGRRGDTGYVLTVVDHGIGMSDDDIEQANQRLFGAESFTVAPSRYLGHYVVAQLAQRHGIAAELGDTPGGGVSATIVLPPALVEGWVYDEPVDEIDEADEDAVALAGATALDTDADPEWIAPAQSLDEVAGIAALESSLEDLDEDAAAFSASFADLMAAEPVELPENEHFAEESVSGADADADDTVLFDFDAWAPVEGDDDTDEAAEPVDVPAETALVEAVEDEPPAVVFPAAEVVDAPAEEVALAAAIADLVAESPAPVEDATAAVTWAPLVEPEPEAEIEPPVIEADASEGPAPEAPEAPREEPFAWANALVLPRREPGAGVPQSEPELTPDAEVEPEPVLSAEPEPQSQEDAWQSELTRFAESELTAWAADSAVTDAPTPPEADTELGPVAEAPSDLPKKASPFRFESEPYAELVALSDPNYVPTDGPDVSAFAPRDDALPELLAFVADATPESAAPPGASATESYDAFGGAPIASEAEAPPAVPEWSAPEPISYRDESDESDASDASQESDEATVAEPVASSDAPGVFADGPEPVHVDTEALAALDDVHVESVPTLTAFEPGLDDLLPQQLPKRSKGRRSLPRRSRSAPPPPPTPASPWVTAPEAPAASPEPAPEPETVSEVAPEPAPVASGEPEAAPALPRRHAEADARVASEAGMPSMAAPAAGFEVPAGANRIGAESNGDGSHETATPEKAPPPSRADFFAAFYAATERGRAEATPGERGTQ